MKPIVSALVFFIAALPCFSQVSDRWIEIVPPSVEDETTSIWRTINDITFLEKQGYTINLPKGELIDSLIARSKKGDFGNDDFSTIFEFVETKVFRPESYAAALKKIEDQIPLMNELINSIEANKDQWDWTFNTFHIYKIHLTLYGTGGSYDPDEGTVTLLTNEKGEFKNYQNPTNTIIHEITHIGMEYSLVRKYKLPHGLKERVVDTFVYLMFKDQLPQYRIQNMGDTRIDNYLKELKDIKTLNRTLANLYK